MTVSTYYPVDVAIFGGGVAGLWLLARLRALGYQAVLLEKTALGAGQTRYAQGIIHGGTKYALTGKLTGSSESIAAMPPIWRACLAGEGEIDLRQVKLLSAHQYLWSTQSVGSRMAGFFASKLMRSRTHNVEGDERPEVFRHRDFRGQVYRLDEPVLDTASLVQVLARPHQDAILHLPVGVGPSYSERGGEDGWQIKLNEARRSLTLQAKRIVLCAGKGNAALLAQLGMDQPRMQTRPLKMVMLRAAPGKHLPGELYAHCVGAAIIPRVTITTHKDEQGKPIWYLGGELAEAGVKRSDFEQIAAARAELIRLFPWLELDGTQWACVQIDRAEPRTTDGERPSNSYLYTQQGILTAWPTKLALAPRLAEKVIAQLKHEGVLPTQGMLNASAIDWMRPEIASMPWQEVSVWS